MRTDPRTIEYTRRRQAEGKTRREIIRFLKRHIAREIHHPLTNPPPTPDGNDLRLQHHQARKHSPTAPNNSKSIPPSYHYSNEASTTTTSSLYPISAMAKHPPKPDLQNIGASGAVQFREGPPINTILGGGSHTFWVVH